MAKITRLKLFEKLILSGILDLSMRDMFFVEASEVQDWIDAATIDDDEGWDASEYERCIPPTGSLWVEWSGINPHTGNLCRSGYSVYKLSPEGIAQFPELLPESMVPEAAHIYIARRFLSESDQLMAVDAFCVIAFDKHGWFIPRPGTRNEVGVVLGPDYDADQQELVVRFSVLSMPVVFWALSHIHNRRDVEHVTSPRQHRRRMERKHGYSPPDFYVVIITETRKRYDPDGAARQAVKRKSVGKKGHFAWYPDEEGHRLFGKHTGLYWKSPHEGDGKAQPFRVHKIKKEIVTNRE